MVHLGRIRTRLTVHIPGWFAKPNHGADYWLGKPSVTVAWLGLALALILSPDRFGASLCWVLDTTGLPCLGCGLTRSLSCALRGMFEQSWHYHPMGMLILALFLF